MNKILFRLTIVVSVLALVGLVLVAIPSQSADLKEVVLVQPKDVKGEAKGKLVINTANGSSPDTSSDARRLITNTIITRMLIRISCFSASSSVPSVSLINPVRS